jgi:glycosyltransferase 2 family protein
MKALPILVGLAGLAVIVALVGWLGAGDVLRALLKFGGLGVAAICAIHLVMMAAMGLAWRALLPGTPAIRVIWARLVRDSGSEALPLSQVGGYVLGARALVLAGVPGMLAAASTIVDVTLEFVAQLGYIALGLGWLVHLHPDSPTALPVAIGLLIAVPIAAAFFFVQRRGFGYVERIAGILGRGWAERSASGAAALHAGLVAIYRRRGGLWWNFALHFACWIASAAEVWLALRIAGEPRPFAAALVIESLVYAIRTAAFVVPQAVGVQEGAYILLGGVFGLSGDIAVALSLLKRARDYAIGLPTLAAWQLVESRRLWRRRRTIAGPAPSAPVASRD